MGANYVVERVKSDLRDEIYDLMRYPQYHQLEKSLTESLLDNNRLYSSLRVFSSNTDIPLDERKEKKNIFAYMVYLKMNSICGGFHFDKMQSFTSGDRENQELDRIINEFSFEDFLDNYSLYELHKGEPHYMEFVKSRQPDYLEDRLAYAIKANEIIPQVAAKIAGNIADVLKLDENYSYIRINEPARDEEYTFNSQAGTDPLIRSALSNTEGIVLFKQASPTSDKYKFLVTNFGALIKGKE